MSPNDHTAARWHTGGRAKGAEWVFMSNRTDDLKTMMRSCDYRNHGRALRGARPESARPCPRSPFNLPSSGGYGPRARRTSARACSQPLWSPARSASRACAMAAATASTFCGGKSPSLASAAAIEPGVG